MGGSFAMVNRNPYLSGSQKLVQARMYAQGSTIAVLLASFAFEAGDAQKGKGRWETIKVLDPNDPEHKHLIEKRVHHERYAGEDQWRGTW
jgi:cytochrome c-type biogenesis protein CcmH/NrfG